MKKLGYTNIVLFETDAKEVILDGEAPESRASMKDLVHEIEVIRKGFDQTNILYSTRASNQVAYY